MSKERAVNFHNIAAAAPLLEKALLVGDWATNRFEASLQLRNSLCGVATGALQRYVKERHDITLERRIGTPPKAPREINSRRMSHVVLLAESEEENIVIDPTHGQFLRYVGLTPARATSHDALADLYLDPKIVMVGAGETREFADVVATHAHRIEPQVQQAVYADADAFGSIDMLVGATLEQKKSVYRDVWNPAHYKTVFPVEEQSTSMQRNVAKVTAEMMRLSA
jgi:hypothetical protein